MPGPARPRVGGGSAPAVRLTLLATHHDPFAPPSPAFPLLQTSLQPPNRAWILRQTLSPPPLPPPPCSVFASNPLLIHRLPVYLVAQLLLWAWATGRMRFQRTREAFRRWRARRVGRPLLSRAKRARTGTLDGAVLVSACACGHVVGPRAMRGLDRG